MKTVTLKSIKLENYKSFSGSLPGRSDFSCEFGDKTKISGRNREGKSSIKDSFFDVLTGKLADGSQPDKIRPHDENGVDIDRVDIIRELGLEIDGKPVTVTKKTAQKWRKPRSQSEEVFDGNITTYAVDGFDIKQKQFTEWQESIADPDVLLMCSNARPFLNTVQKSTSESRKILERMSGFKIEDFIAQNPEYAQIEEITKGHSVEDTLKQLRKNLNTQKKSADKARTELSYEKSREPEKGETEIAELQKSVDEYNEQIAELDDREKSLNNVIAAYDQKSKNIMDLKFEQSEIVRKANEGIVSRKKRLNEDIFLLEQEKRNAENDLRMAEMDLKNAGMGIERHSAELEKAKKDWKEYSSREYPEENLEHIKAEQFDDSTLICPTCGQDFPAEQAEKIRSEFEQKKAKRIKDEEGAKTAFYEAKDRKLTEITETGNKVYKDLKEANKAKEEAEQKIVEIKKSISDLSLKIAEKEKELSALPAEVDLSDDKEYQSVQMKIILAEKALNDMDNGSSARAEITEKRNVYIRESAKLAAEINKIQSDIAEHDRRIDVLEEKLKAEGQRCADIERDIGTLLNFSLEKNKALAEKINPHFRHFQFSFLDYTIEGNPVETLKLVCDGTSYFDGLNGGDQRLVELDLCRGLQEINGLCLPIWLDESNTIDPERIPQDLEQQLICLERADCSLKVEVM